MAASTNRGAPELLPGTLDRLVAAIQAVLRLA